MRLGTWEFRWEDTGETGPTSRHLIAVWLATARSRKSRIIKYEYSSRADFIYAYWIIDCSLTLRLRKERS